MTILQVEGLKKYFGGVHAVEDIFLQLQEREIRAVIGPNGAGKTTFFNAISGKYPPTSGKVFLAGKDITGFPPHRISRLGLGKSFQVTNIFEGLTVFENVQAAVLSFKNKGWNFLTPASRLKEINDEVMEILKAIGLEGKANFPSTSLSHGEQRHLEIGLALGGRPRILLFDEPTAGMTPYESLQTMELIKKLVREKGVTILFAEHDMDVVFSVAARITVMHQGKIIAEGTPVEIKQNHLVKDVYLGRAYVGT
jgi:branched-chain amino acid transport system ATP-binding protein